MSFPKKVFYDWAGGNESLFLAVNGHAGPFLDTLLLVISQASDPKHYPAVLCVMALMAVLDWVLRKIRGRGGADHALIAWFGVVCVFILAQGLDSFLVTIAKSYFQMPRPYVVLPPEEIALLDYRYDAAEAYRSFPSGHVAYVTVLAASLWPVISSGMQKVAMLGIFMVSWSRIAVGVHFPADVFYSVLLAIIITPPIRWYLYAFLFKLFKIKC